MRLKGKVALVTGGSSGMGRATALLFSEEGAKVVIADINAEGGNETVSKIRNTGGEAIFVAGDITKETEAKKIVEIALTNYGKLDILFNNAGIVFVKDIVETGEEEWDRVLSINLKGMFLMSKYTIPEMIKTGGGSIINMASIYGLVGATKYTAYCASKGGVIALTKAMALELAPYKIRVNCVCPGNISTPMLDKEAAIWGKIWGKTPEQVQEEFIRMEPIGRLGVPKEIAYNVLFLASDESSFVTGSAVVVDGGLTAC
jgi:NAD(P)-dependent dehydrogenase (short-subunit alcohol dehydrogenase family)